MPRDFKIIFKRKTIKILILSIYSDLEILYSYILFILYMLLDLINQRLKVNFLYRLV